ERLADVLCEMRSAGIEPKRVLSVHPKPARAPALFLVEGAKGGRPGLVFCEPLYVHDSDGRFSEAMRRMYGEH
ncbi:MAG: SAM-dependent methyltransferase, partial [Firmicutes bacterium]|nr:SAM-dependent methyltransferase [Bacillota bacterium]